MTFGELLEIDEEQTKSMDDKFVQKKVDALNAKINDPKSYPDIAVIIKAVPEIQTMLTILSTVNTTIATVNTTVNTLNTVTSSINDVKAITECFVPVLGFQAIPKVASEKINGVISEADKQIQNVPSMATTAVLGMSLPPIPGA